MTAGRHAAQALAPPSDAAAAEADELAAAGPRESHGEAARRPAAGIKVEPGAAGAAGAVGATGAAANGGAPTAARPGASEEVADMAAEWAGVFAAGPESGAGARCGIAGLAASVLVCACPRRAACPRAPGAPARSQLAPEGAVRTP